LIREGQIAGIATPGLEHSTQHGCRRLGGGNVRQGLDRIECHNSAERRDAARGIERNRPATRPDLRLQSQKFEIRCAPQSRSDAAQSPQRPGRMGKLRSAREAAPAIGPVIRHARRRRGA
jgi:hypothetical protein